MKYLSILITLFLISACSSSDELEIVPETPNTGQGTEVGPFSLKLSTRDNPQTNSFNVDIAQEDSGFVDFILPAAEKTRWIQLESFVTKVRGCDVNDVLTTHIWIRKDTDTAMTLTSGGKAKTLPNQEAKLSVYFEGLGECTEISYEAVVKLIEDESEIPKSWSAQVDKDLIGKWIHKDGFKEYKIEVTSSYMTFTDNSAGFCLLSHGILTDRTQDPRWLRADYSEDELLCKYQINNDKLNIECPNMEDWSCRLPKEVQFTKEKR